jgi:hypothetical protein
MTSAAFRDSDILIIGAGLAGIMAARTLRDAGIEALVVDKGRSVGGRLATRRIGEGRADHGAQYLTAETPAFRRIVADWLQDGIVREWCTGWSAGSVSIDRTEALVRHVGPWGMNSIAHRLATGLSTLVDTRVASLSASDDDGWEVTTTEGHAARAKVVIATPPVPQTLELLAAGNVHLERDDHRALRRVEYVPNLTGLFLLEGDVDIPSPGIVESADAETAWLVDNTMKGISPEARILTVQANAEFSAKHYDDDDETTLLRMQSGLGEHLARNASVVERQLKRWRYANPIVCHPTRVFEPCGVPRLICAGDAFGGLRIEGAALSGIAAGQRAAQILRGEG